MYACIQIIEKTFLNKHLFCYIDAAVITITSCIPKLPLGLVYFSVNKISFSFTLICVYVQEESFPALAFILINWD